MRKVWALLSLHVYVCPLPNSFAETLTHNGMVSEGGTSGRQLGLHEVMKVGPPGWENQL